MRAIVRWRHVASQKRSAWHLVSPVWDGETRCGWRVDRATAELATGEADCRNCLRMQALRG